MRDYGEIFASSEEDFMIYITQTRQNEIIPRMTVISGKNLKKADAEWKEIYNKLIAHYKEECFRKFYSLLRNYDSIGKVSDIKKDVIKYVDGYVERIHK